MKHTSLRKALAAVLALALCLSLAGCGGSSSSDSELSEDVADMAYATAGGDIALPPELVINTTANTLTNQVSGNALVGGLTLASYRSSSYFLIAGDSVTVTANINLTDSSGEAVTTKYTEYTVALWHKLEGATEYVTTAHFTADGTNYSYTFTGLQSGGEYRVGFTYSDIGSYRMNGTFSITPITGTGSEEETVAAE